MKTTEIQQSETKTKGRAFCLSPKLIPTSISQNPNFDPKTKEILMKAEKYEIDLKNKFVCWGVLIEAEIENEKIIKDNFSIIFFSRNSIDSGVLTNYHIKFEEFNEELFIKKIEEFVEKYNTTMKEFII